MLIWFFTILDAIVLVIVLLAQLGVWDHWRFILGGAGYLILKGLAFRGELLSTVDLVFGVYMLIMLLGARWFITWLLVAWLIYKIFFSFFGS